MFVAAVDGSHSEFVQRTIKAAQEAFAARPLATSDDKHQRIAASDLEGIRRYSLQDVREETRAGRRSGRFARRTKRRRALLQIHELFVALLENLSGAKRAILWKLYAIGYATASTAFVTSCPANASHSLSRALSAQLYHRNSVRWSNEGA